MVDHNNIEYVTKFLKENYRRGYSVKELNNMLKDKGVHESVIKKASKLVKPELYKEEAVEYIRSLIQQNLLILVSTDHGRTEDGSHGGETTEERTIFFLASGPSAQVGMLSETPVIADVAVTALGHLGIEIDSAWGLDGRVVGLRPR